LDPNWLLSADILGKKNAIKCVWQLSLLGYGVSPIIKTRKERRIGFSTISRQSNVIFPGFIYILLSKITFYYSSPGFPIPTVGFNSLPNDNQ
jgi:hypothetical protein